MATTKTSTAAKKTTTSSSKANSKTPAKKDAAKDLNDLFEDSLKDIYWAEKALVKALPKMMKNATNEKLKTAIENHLAETKIHVTRLEEC